MAFCKCVALAVASMALAGCGGGGGGGSTAPAATAFASGAHGRTHSVFLPAGGSSYQVTDKTGATGVASTVAVSGNTATVSTSGNMAGGHAPFSGTITGSATANSAGTSISGSNGVIINLTQAGTPAAPSSLTSSSYGLIVGAAPGGATVGGYHQGTATAQSSMPGNITATYNGAFVGQQIYHGTSTSLTVLGNSSVTANFGAGTVNGKVTNITNDAGAVANYGLSINGAITGNTYSGTVGYTNAAGTASIGSVSSSAMTGAFYGPGAAETAGALQVTGAPIASTSTIVGAFGGKR